MLKFSRHLFAWDWVNDGSSLSFVHFFGTLPCGFFINLFGDPSRNILLQFYPERVDVEEFNDMCSALFFFQG